MEYEASGQVTRARSAVMADQIVDELMPEELDWRHLVQTYPFPVMILAIVTGFFLGRHRGHWLLGALSGFAVQQATRNVSEAFERIGIADSASTASTYSPTN